MTPRCIAALTLAAIALLASGCAAPDDAAAGGAAAPNILIIYTDDVGYGDLSIYNPRGLIETPELDALAASGRVFTSGYAASATCTPSRYSLLTGKYPFRNARAEILDGDDPLLIEPGSLTLASHLRDAGYRTAVIGKWHLGIGDGDTDWNTAIDGTPLDIGFDVSFLLPATNDRVPTVYLDSRRVVNLDPTDPLEVSFGEPVGDRPTGRDRPDLLRYTADNQHSDSIVNRISRIGYMAGGADADWVDEDMAEVFTERAIDFIEDARDDNEPFFLFFNLHSIHVPRAPAERFLGKSEVGIRGDAMLEADWSVGEIVDALDRLGLRENTLVVFSSDNGPVLNDGYDDGAAEANGDHRPAGPFSGGKYEVFEGGTRVPFIVSQPGTVAPGTSDALVSQLDFLPTFAALAERPLDPATAADLDGQDLRPAFLGASDTGREELVTQAVYAEAIRVGDWKYIEPRARPAWARDKHAGADNPLRTRNLRREPQLFNLADDPAERTNVIAEHPTIAADLAARLAAARARPAD